MAVPRGAGTGHPAAMMGLSLPDQEQQGASGAIFMSSKRQKLT